MAASRMRCSVNPLVARCLRDLGLLADWVVTGSMLRGGVLDDFGPPPGFHPEATHLLQSHADAERHDVIVGTADDLDPGRNPIGCDTRRDIEHGGSPEDVEGHGHDRLVPGHQGVTDRYWHRGV